MTKSGEKDSPKQPPQFTERELQRLLRHSYRPPQRGRKGQRLRGGGRGGARERTQKEMELLGKFSDRETARLLRRSFSSVNKTRTRLGIPPHRPLQAWTKQELRWLGKLPDAEVAQRTGRTEEAAKCKLIHLGRPKPDTKAPPLWTAREEALVGRFSDAEVARRIGRSAKAVISRRRVLGMGTLFDRRLEWTPAQDKLLGTAPDEEIARRLGRKKSAVEKRRLTNDQSLIANGIKAPPPSRRQRTGMIGFPGFVAECWPSSASFALNRTSNVSPHISRPERRVRGPGLQEPVWGTCRPRALTRRTIGVSIDVEIAGLSRLPNIGPACAKFGLSLFVPVATSADV